MTQPKVPQKPSPTNSMELDKPNPSIRKILFSFHQQFNSYYEDYQDGVLTLGEWEEVRGKLVNEAERQIEDLIREARETERDELWDEIAEIENVVVMIPVNYNPDSRIITIPRDDDRGEAYTVLAKPTRHIEKIFEKYPKPLKNKEKKS